MEEKKFNVTIYTDGACSGNPGAGGWGALLMSGENKKEFSRDTIIRLYSMSKPVTSVAAMILIERGILDFTDEVSQYIPEFADLTVCKDGKIQKSSRPLLIQDLLNMTSGYTYGGNEDEGQKQTSALLSELNQSVLEKNDIRRHTICRCLLHKYFYNSITYAIQ